MTSTIALHRVRRLGDDAAAQPQTPAPLPVADAHRWLGFPIVFLLLFVYVFGGQLGASLGGHGTGGRGAYLTYVVPGILIITVGIRRSSAPRSPSPPT